MNTLRLLACCLTLVTTIAGAQTAPPPANPLEALAHWVGGEWVGSFDAGNGKRFTLIRRYEWSFDRRLLVGRSFGESDGKRVQSRETLYFWNPETRRIEFTDHIDRGGFGSGFVELRPGEVYMDAKITGSNHPAWRAWMKDGADEQVLRVEALRDGQWVPFGTYPYKRQR